MTSRHIVEFLRDLKEEGKTIILSAHNLYQVEAICDHILILHRGERVESHYPSLEEMLVKIGA